MAFRAKWIVLIYPPLQDEVAPQPGMGDLLISGKGEKGVQGPPGPAAPMSLFSKSGKFSDVSKVP